MSATAQVIGFIGSIEQKFLPSGSSVVEFSVASTKKWKDKNSGQMQEKTSWINLKVFGFHAENIFKYFQKGSGIIAYGDLEVDTWENNGVKNYKTYINVSSWSFPPCRSGGNNDGYQQQAQNNATQQQQQQQQQQGNITQQQKQGLDAFDDDIPF